MDTINPLLSFSSADIADMDQEVEDIFNETESDGDDDVEGGVGGDAAAGANQRPNKPTRRRKRNPTENSAGAGSVTSPKRPRPAELDAESESSSSSADSLSGNSPQPAFTSCFALSKTTYHRAQLFSPFTVYFQWERSPFKAMLFVAKLTDRIARY